MGSGNVVLNDDFRVRVQFLNAADEVNGIAGIACRVRWIAEDEREFRYDSELADSRRELQGLGAGDALVHLLQHFVGAGFGAEEYHGGSGTA
jgi:hypothetical protein